MITNNILTVDGETHVISVDDTGDFGAYCTVGSNDKRYIDCAVDANAEAITIRKQKDNAIR